MAWTAPRTWTTGEVVTASIMNTYVRDNDKEIWREIGYDSTAGNTSVTTSATTIITGSSRSYDGSACLFWFKSPSVTPDGSGGGGHSVNIGLYMDGSLVELFATVVNPSSVSDTIGVPVSGVIRYTPTAASHTFAVKGTAGFGTATVNGVANLMIMCKGS